MRKSTVHTDKKREDADLSISASTYQLLFFSSDILEGQLFYINQIKWMKMMHIYWKYSQGLWETAIIFDKCYKLKGAPFWGKKSLLKIFPLSHSFSPPFRQCHKYTLYSQQ